MSIDEKLDEILREVINKVDDNSYYPQGSAIDKIKALITEARMDELNKMAIWTVERKLERIAELKADKE